MRFKAFGLNWCKRTRTASNYNLRKFIVVVQNDASAVSDLYGKGK